MNDDNNSSRMGDHVEDPYAPDHMKGMNRTRAINTNAETVGYVNGQVLKINRAGGRFAVDGSPPPVDYGQTIERAATTFGRPVSGAHVTPDTVVNIGGLEVQIADAISAGLVREERDGSFRVLSRAERTEQEVAQAKRQTKSTSEGEDNEPSHMESLPPDIERQVTEIASGSSPNDALAVLNSYTEDGTVNETALGRIASSMGIEPGEAQTRFQTIVSGFEEQARKAVTKAGVDDPEAFFEWAWEHRREDMQKAMRDQAKNRTTKGYAKLAGEFGTTSYLDLPPDDIINAQLPDGVSARKLKTGEVILNVRGVEVSWKEAVRRGLVSKVTRL